MIDSVDAPARTMLTSEGRFGRGSHLIRDIKTGMIRTLTPTEAERINGFPDGWTDECILDGVCFKTPDNVRFFEMGNALVVGLISEMESTLSKLLENEIPHESNTMIITEVSIR